jgi:trimeric autotransporter adhesin
MRKLLLISSVIIASCFSSRAQITSNAADTSSTAYTNGATNDSLYFFCNGALGNLTATPASGIPGWNFIWQIFNPATNSWDPFTVVNGQPSSTITNLNGGGYRVTVVDGTGAVVGCYRAWVIQVTTPTTVDVAPIPPGCTGFTLNGSITPGNANPYYNPPPDPFLVDATTQITVCFTATHTWVSDLGFYLVGPTSCGSPTVVLSPNPGSIGQGAVCNAGNNVNNLCFSTTSAANLNVCTAAAPLSGTYGRYGAGAGTAINWSTIYGCDATQGGWRVQIYDCIGADVGNLTNAVITFNGSSICGQPSTVTYNSGAINSPIADNSCSSATASIYTVGSSAAVPIPYSGGFIWTADPPYPIPNATTSLSPTINPPPTVPTIFTLTLTGGHVSTCGGNNSDSELFVYIQPTPPTISPAGPFCLTDGDDTLDVNAPGGTWSGTGIINSSIGIFSPATFTTGDTVTITYTSPGGCGGTDTEDLVVVQAVDPSISQAGPFCTNDAPVNLTAASQGGTWSGPGITDSANGTFDPSQATVGTNQVIVNFGGLCPSADTMFITVNALPDPTITPVNPMCIDASPVNLVAATQGGTWSGNGVNSSGQFNPAIGSGPQMIIYSIATPCPVADTIIIQVNALPVPNAGNNAAICIGDSTNLSGSGGTSFLWSPSTGLSADNIANPIAFPSVTTPYILTVTDQNGCDHSDTVVVTVNNLPNVSGGNNLVICPGGTGTTLNASGAQNYTWTPATGLSNPNIANPNANPAVTTVYSVTGTDANGCVNTSSVTVTVDGVIASFIPTPGSGIEPLTVVFINTSTGGSVNNWNYGNGETETTTSDSTVTIYDTLGTYTVTLIVLNASGCSDTVTFTIEVFEDFSLLIPNVFSPNGDGVNDFFEIQSEGIKTMSLTIFNRWGQEIYVMDSPDDKWDGSDQSEGTYFYTFQCTSFSGVDKTLNGTITLFKK